MFDLPGKKLDAERLESLVLSPDFWNDQDKAKKIQKELGQLQELIEAWEKNFSDLEDADMLLEMAVEERDEDTQQEVVVSIEQLRTRVDEVELECMFDGEHDANNAIVTIHAGAGGTEAQDWVSMLMRMYMRWAEDRGFAVSILDYLAGDEAGVKSVTIMVKGRHAYGLLRSEVGIHRLVRISPFDASGRRHTSFASVMVMPELDDTIDIDINEKDLRIDTYRASGAGGQHVNKTDSAIRITHLPSGIVVQCQNERSQHKNKATAMKVLKSRLFEYYSDEQEKEHEKHAKEKKDISWGNQIRSYVFHPYNMVKDHRTKYEVGNIQSVMDGKIDGFIESYLKWNWTGE
ncbi:MAG: peptide chain release factor 2 [Spirochaetales bacterium]|nr:peptide chain release factor 2 [Spirochaetales bacterium]